MMTPIFRAQDAAAIVFPQHALTLETLVLEGHYSEMPTYADCEVNSFLRGDEDASALVLSWAVGVFWVVALVSWNAYTCGVQV